MPSAFSRDRLRAQLRLHEGVKTKPYRCTAGFLTIGVGHNLDAHGLSDAVIDVILDEDIDTCLRDLDALLPWWRRLDDIRQRVLIDLCFNLGITKLLKFRRTLQALQAGRYGDAANYLNESLWATQVGDGPGGVYDRAERLTDMLRTGQDYTK